MASWETRLNPEIQVELKDVFLNRNVKIHTQTVTADALKGDQRKNMQLLDYSGSLERGPEAAGQEVTRLDQGQSEQVMYSHL